jgi:hypothetical protein
MIGSTRMMSLTRAVTLCSAWTAACLGSAGTAEMLPVSRQPFGDLGGDLLSCAYQLNDPAAIARSAVKATNIRTGEDDGHSPAKAQNLAGRE